jgi:hypothetical protein
MNKLWMGLMAASILGVGHSTPLQAAEFNGLNEKCQPAPTAPEEWKIENTFKFQSGNRTYRLVYSRTQDAGGSLCFGTGQSLRPVGAQYWQGEYVDRVTQLRNRVFMFQIHEGNGNPITNRQYKLDLTRPRNPKITLIKTWVEN